MMIVLFLAGLAACETLALAVLLALLAEEKERAKRKHKKPGR